MHTFHMVSLFGRTVFAKKMTFYPSTTLYAVLFHVSVPPPEARAPSEVRPVAATRAWRVTGAAGAATFDGSVTGVRVAPLPSSALPPVLHPMRMICSLPRHRSLHTSARCAAGVIRSYLPRVCFQ